MTETEVGGLTVRLEASKVAVGIVVARGCVVRDPGPAFESELEATIAAAVSETDEATTRAVRDVLRFGKYKPTGRGKPASEYLVRAAKNGAFPRINNLVDLNNLVSLASSLPISLVDLDRAATSDLTVRRGREGESYVFNQAGQTIDLQDLLLVARGPLDEPCANPVKDSMATKLGSSASAVAAVLYAPPAMPERLDAACRRFAAGFEAWADADEVAWRTLTA